MSRFLDQPPVFQSRFLDKEPAVHSRLPPLYSIGTNPRRYEFRIHKGKEERRAAIVLENYDNIEDETLKKQILSVALGQSTNHDQKFEEPIKMSEVPEKYLMRFGEKVKVGVCPECSVHYSQLGADLNREAEEDLKEELVLIHISKEHPKIWELIKHLYHPEKSDLPSQQVTWTSNPESCSEDLSKEELSQEISSNPDLRAKLLRKWKTQKETKNRSQ